MNEFVVSTSCQMALHIGQTRGKPCTASLARARLTDAEVRTPGLRLPAEKVSRFWDALAAEWRDPNVGFTVATGVPFGAYLVPNLLAAGSRTIGEGLARACASFSLIHSGAHLMVRETRQAVRIEFACPRPDDVSPHYVDYVLTTLVCHSRSATEIDWHPTALRLRPRSHGVSATMRRFFGGKIVSDCERSGLDVARGDWTNANRNVVPGLIEVLEAERDRRLNDGERPHSYTGVLGHLVRAALGREAVTLTHLAAKLSISTRTLQRKLAAEKATFEDIVDDARRTLALTYLEDRALTKGQIGYLLGYSEPSAFLRALRRWKRLGPRRQA